MFYWSNRVLMQRLAPLNATVGPTYFVALRIALAAAEQDRISWVEGELDRIAAAIREVREYIEWAREQAQARRAAGVERTRHPLDSYSNRTCATWIFGDCSLLHSCIGSSGESSPERNARR